MNLVEKAVMFATSAHAGIMRKGKNKPYILHPIEAMTIVGSLTDDKELLAATVLHDTIEDTGVTWEDLNREFGGRVANLVASESEDKRLGTPPEDTWWARKQETITHLQGADRDVKLVCLGDKLANLRELAQDYSQVGEDLWLRFNQKDKALHGCYYRSVYSILENEFGNVPVIAEYKKLLTQVFGEEICNERVFTEAAGR